ncbi:hypothetical protein ASD11_03265 [Aeromicrobium sp. Root495]|uniref:DUF559 domain-containing protein n=1 Tax=Aeromicrobium sp. Root495 TaxID=1736550 RepID=UPI0006F65B5A|nr:DUF559 domain-containing protein [Aeromicrobium sp. Root495]KQY58684.1 hypothetical protein ASD11_03265 [Aeromicrobium sp. Root495]
MLDIPAGLLGRPFTRVEANRTGVSDRMLRGQRFVRIHAGVYRTADTPASLPLLARAALLVLPPGSALSHVSNLQLRGFAVGPGLPLHFASDHPHQHVREGVRLHRYLRPVITEIVDGLPVTDPLRTFVDVATQLDDRRLLRVGDWFVGSQGVSLEQLRSYAHDSHLDGVRRARRVVRLVAERVASPRETDLRWWLHRGGLPDPEVNVEIHDDRGQWLARGDLVYRKEKVLVEYDGWQHERDARQRQWDHLRREQLEAAGWRLVVITSADLKNPRHVVQRVRQALAARA